jgi:hypothetical protein
MRDFFLQFNNLPYFTKGTVVLSANRLGVKPIALSMALMRAVKTKELISFKRNYYVTADFYEKHKTEQSYLFFLANTFLQPSYVSLESALQHYGILAEAVNIAVTSVTLDLPREVSNSLGLFKYRQLSEDFFEGYTQIKKAFPYLIARPYKAIFDYLYYQTDRFRLYTTGTIEDLRLDLDDLEKEDLENLEILIKKIKK